MSRLRLYSVSAAIMSAGLIVGAGLPAMAQAIPQPAIGAPKPVTVPATQTYELANGIKVTLIPYAVVPRTVISVRVPVGNNSDGDDTWLSDVTVGLMKEGAGGRSGVEVSEAFADMGGTLSANVNNTRTSFTVAVLSEHAREAIAILADITQRPSLPEEALDRVSQGLARNLTVTRSTPNGQASEAYYRTIFAGHPYANLMPSEGQLQAYTIEGVRDFYASNYGGKGTHIYVGGQFDADEIRATVAQNFEGWASNNTLAIVPEAPRITRRVILIDRPDAPQSTIKLAMNAPEFGGLDYIRYEVMDSLLGGAFNSRITTNIREDKGYTYSPFSALTVIDRDTTHWEFNADVTAENTGDSLREVFNEIARLKAQAPTDDETIGTRNISTGNFVMGMATTAGVVGHVARRNERGMPIDYFDRYIPWVMSVTSDDIQKAAQSLDLAQMTLIVVGDLNSIRPQLEALPELSGVPFEIFQP